MTLANRNHLQTMQELASFGAISKAIYCKEVLKSMGIYPTMLGASEQSFKDQLETEVSDWLQGVY